MEVFIYIIKSLAILSIFYAVYFLFFRKETLFTCKRHFFLAGIIAAFGLPFVSFTRRIYLDQFSSSMDSLEVSPIVNSINASITAGTFNWLLMPVLVYVIGVAVFIVRFLMQLLSLGKVLSKHPVKKQGQYLFIETAEKISPFSFFNYIVFNPRLHTEEELAMIIHHEKVHVSQWHSIDLIAAHLLCSIQWMNPLAWLYNRSIEENLEFIADQETAAQVDS